MVILSLFAIFNSFFILKDDKNIAGLAEIPISLNSHILTLQEKKNCLNNAMILLVTFEI